MNNEPNKPAEKQEIRKLSPSRIDTLLTCSWTYHCNYILKLNDGGNMGSRLGDALHRLYETVFKGSSGGSGKKGAETQFGTFKHKAKVDKIVESGDIRAVPAVYRYLKILCAKNGHEFSEEIVNRDKSGLTTVEEYVCDMAYVGFAAEFFGKDGEEFIAEYEHSMEYKDESKGIHFEIRGFLDKTFIKRKKNGKVEYVRIEDFKSSKTKDKFTKGVNYQNMIYKMFMRDKFKIPYKDISMRFIMLQFPKNPLIDGAEMDDETEEGLKHYLSALFEKVNNFDINSAYENFAHYGEGRFLCGKDGTVKITDKKTKRKCDTKFPAWKCPYQSPYEYFEISKPCGRIIRTAKKQEDLKLTQVENMSIIAGELKLEKKMYHGCPAFNRQPHQQ